MFLIAKAGVGQLMLMLPHLAGSGNSSTYAYQPPDSISTHASYTLDSWQIVERYKKLSGPLVRIVYIFSMLRSNILLQLEETGGQQMRVRDYLLDFKPVELFEAVVQIGSIPSRWLQGRLNNGWGDRSARFRVKMCVCCSMYIHVCVCVCMSMCANLP